MFDDFSKLVSPVAILTIVGTVLYNWGFYITIPMGVLTFNDMVLSILTKLPILFMVSLFCLVLHRKAMRKNRTKKTKLSFMGRWLLKKDPYVGDILNCFGYAVIPAVGLIVVLVLGVPLQAANLFILALFIIGFYIYSLLLVRESLRELNVYAVFFVLCVGCGVFIREYSKTDVISINLKNGKKIDGKLIQYLDRGPYVFDINLKKPRLVMESNVNDVIYHTGFPTRREKSVPKKETKPTPAASSS